MWIERVKESLEKAENLTSKLDYEVIDFTGMTSPKMKHFLNNICSYENVKYLEIGLGTGSTITSSLFKNEHVKSFASDIWLTKKVGENGKEKFEEVYDYFLGEMRTKIFSGDCFTINPENFFEGEKINVYLYDGGHEVEDHFKALEHFLPAMEKQFVLIVDDWNDDRVKKGTEQALKELPVNVLLKEERQAQLNTTSGWWGDVRTDPNVGWWNGLLVLVLEKK